MHGGSCLATITVELYRARWGREERGKGGGDGGRSGDGAGGGEGRGGTKRPEPAAVHNHSATDSSNDTLPPVA